MKTKSGNFTENTGVMIRQNGVLFIWSDETKIDIILSVSQMKELSRALIQVASQNQEKTKKVLC